MFEIQALHTNGCRRTLRTFSSRRQLQHGQSCLLAVRTTVLSAISMAKRVQHCMPHLWTLERACMLQVWSLRAAQVLTVLELMPLPRPDRRKSPS